ncbi:hypothetical protein ACIRBZ_37210 [Streptomyces sp. NPDC094038]|uniref:hypothetical protein n=1 Tax=Streptomyces sp. NPDC094038 TaxID=3366055 RepID=UPI0037FCCD64
MDGTSGTPWRTVQEPRALVSREPIYAQLAREWREQGRTVPAEPESRWAAVLILLPRR